MCVYVCVWGFSPHQATLFLFQISLFFFLSLVLLVVVDSAAFALVVDVVVVLTTGPSWKQKHTSKQNSEAQTSPKRPK